MLDDAEIMRFAPAPPALARHVAGFGHRRDERGGDVVIVLPETRPTIQLMLADDYWLRETAPDAPWRRVPRLALWGPRLVSGYGFAARRIHAFGLSLTPAGMRALAGPPADYVNAAVDLGLVDAGLSSRLVGAAFGRTFEAWIDAACRILEERFAGAAPPAPISGAIDILASPSAASIADAARRLELSERQFRRLFSREFGAPPKTYQRLLRFDATLRALHPRPWENPPADGGGKYADQAHLIREFCAIARVTPGAYVRNKELHGDRILRSIVIDGVAPPDI